MVTPPGTGPVKLPGGGVNVGVAAAGGGGGGVGGLTGGGFAGGGLAGGGFVAGGGGVPASTVPGPAVSSSPQAMVEDAAARTPPMRTRARKRSLNLVNIRSSRRTSSKWRDDKSVHKTYVDKFGILFGCDTVSTAKAAFSSSLPE